MFEKTIVALRKINCHGLKAADMRYAARIAFFNAIMFFSISAGDTYIDKQLTTNEFGPRVYWMGYWVLALVPIIFVLNYLALVRTTRLLYRISLPFLITVTSGWLLSLVNFHPPFPNLGQMGAFALFACPGPVSAVIAYRHFEDIRTNDTSIRFEARMEWVKERVTLWRSIAVTGTFGLVALTVPWMIWQSSMAGRDAAKPWEQNLRANFLAFQGFLLLLYSMCGPIYESFLKAKRVTSAYFELPEKRL